MNTLRRVQVRGFHLVPKALRATGVLVGAILSLTLCDLVPAGPSWSDDGSKAVAAPSGSAPQPAAKKFSYRPPKRGAPMRTEGGGTRGFGESLYLTVLAPDHLGFTISEQPSLYWYVSKIPEHDVVFTLTDKRRVDAIAEKTLAKPSSAGVQEISLASLGARLDLDVEYQWFISVVPDRDHRSKDIVTTAGIARVAPFGEIASKLGDSKGLQAAPLYAEAGLWYDALAALGGAGSESRARRGELLEQVGLGRVTAAERAAAER
jgi:hypothetical protein